MAYRSQYLFEWKNPDVATDQWESQWTSQHQHHTGLTPLLGKVAERLVEKATWNEM